MKFGFVFPFGNAVQAVAWAQTAEQAGWDGFFIADLIWGLDAWSLLAAIAVQTHRIRLGTMLTPMPWIKPWKLASETVTLDHLSGGRTILAVGLGANDTGAGNYGLETDRKLKAELLDEGLEIITRLWQGQSIQYSGKHYTLTPTTFPPPPPPVQQPRIPVWVVGVWPRMKSIARVFKYDGILPMKLSSDGKIGQAEPADVQALNDYAKQHRSSVTPFDIIVEGHTSGEDKRAGSATLQPWAESGATWWIESRWGQGEAAVLARLRQGPPQL